MNSHPIRLLLACLLLLGLAPALLAQSAPAGNSHPQTRMLAETGLPNPFGEPPLKATLDLQGKLRFAAEVDLRPLRDLAVYHNGRVKVLDSLARETIGEILGRKDYQDLIPEQRNGETLFRKVGYDPLFTFLDMIIDPSYYADRPLVGVNFLPLRKQFLELEFPGKTANDEDIRETWKRLVRLTPLMVSRHIRTISDSNRLDGAYAKGLNDLHESVNLYLGAPGTLLLVPVADTTKPWSHLSQAGSGPVADAVAALGKAWRAGDAAGVNAAAATLAQGLPAIQPEVYPTVRRSLELAYNRAKPFEWGAWLYAGALVSLLLAFGTHRAWLKWTGLVLLLGGVAFHAFGFGVRCYVAERFAIQNQFESMTGVSLFAAIVGLALAARKRQWLFGAATAAVGFMVLITATQTGIPGQSINREAAILNTSVLLKYHVTTVLFSYGLISLGFIVSLFYLAMWYTSNRTPDAPEGPTALSAVTASALSVNDPAAARDRLLLDLDKAQTTLMQLAFWTLGVGILLGAWWADHSWGRWWAFDPKELWALLTWIVYLVVVHVRVAGVKRRGLVTAWLSALGFCVMLFCYFGVNLLLPGLHAYA